MYSDMIFIIFFLSFRGSDAFLYCFDFSSRAIQLVKVNNFYIFLILPGITIFNYIMWWSNVSSRPYQWNENCRTLREKTVGLLSLHFVLFPTTLPTADQSKWLPGRGVCVCARTRIGPVDTWCCQNAEAFIKWRQQAASTVNAFDCARNLRGDTDILNCNIFKQ